MRIMIAVLGTLALAACEPGAPGGGDGTFVQSNGAVVDYSDRNTPFTVRPRAGAGAPDYWCAAGEAVGRVLPNTTRIYLVEPITRGQPATFTLVPPPGGGAPTGLSIIGGAADNSLSVTQAKNQCRPRGGST